MEVSNIKETEEETTTGTETRFESTEEQGKVRPPTAKSTQMQIMLGVIAT